MGRGRSRRWGSKQGEGQRGRGRKNPRAHPLPSVESGVGLYSRTFRSWPELKSRVCCLTNWPPRHPKNKINFYKKSLDLCMMPCYPEGESHTFHNKTTDDCWRVDQLFIYLSPTGSSIFKNLCNTNTKPIILPDWRFMRGKYFSN